MLKPALRIAANFLKVGVIGFGGGSALIPVIHNELVAKGGLLSEEDYLKHTVVANITPGALPVKLGATWGAQFTGSAGSVLSAYAVALPGVLATVLLIAFFSTLGPDAIDHLNYASIGITVFIVYLLLHYVGATVRTGNIRINAAICCLAFFLTGGKEVREIVQLAAGMEAQALGRPLFDLSMISVMLLSFFGIAWVLLAGGSRRTLGAGAGLGIAFAVLSGKMASGWQYSDWARGVIVAGMLAGVAALLRGRPKRRGGRRIRFDRSLGWAAAAFLVLPAAVFVLALAGGVIWGTEGVAAFLGDIVVSALTSFGGGEAYVAVADSMFVQTGYCGAEMFYGRIVPVANALPGPILVKIAAAVGFVWGEGTLGMRGGAVMALLCGMLATGACSALALVVLNYYEALRDSVFMLSLKRYVLPVICGTLVSTSLAMLFESMKVAGRYGYGPAGMLGTMSACVLATFWLASRVKVNDIVLLVCWIAASVLIMRVL